MALKGDRIEFLTDISYFGNSVMTRGGVVTTTTIGSGAALDQSAALVAYSATSSGTMPAGLLLNDMVNLDLTRQHPNLIRDEVQVGGKVTLLTKGWVVTDMITGTPTNGDVALLSNSGNVQPISAASYTLGSYPKTVYPYVGRFMSSKDEDGFAKLAVDLL